jgi:hypothetical protein
VGLQFWKKASPSSGFALGGLDDRFAEACERLGVTRISPLNLSYSGRTRGAVVETPDACRYWLKVYGVTSPDHPLRQGEIASDALQGIRKPHLIRQIEWTNGDVLWTARLTTLADDAVQQTPWAGEAAAAVTDAWLEELKANLDSLVTQPSARTFLSQERLSAWLAYNYRLRYSFSEKEWVTSHNDLQWSNLTGPSLCILDWESFGLAPIGYDAGRLIAYSCCHTALVMRLEKVFSAHFTTPAGMIGRLCATFSLKQHAQQKNLAPELIAALDDMIARLLADIRALPGIRKSTITQITVHKWTGLKRRLSATLAN